MLLRPKDVELRSKEMNSAYHKKESERLIASVDDAVEVYKEILNRGDLNGAIEARNLTSLLIDKAQVHATLANLKDTF
jgi:hypothetical protein